MSSWTARVEISWDTEPTSAEIGDVIAALGEHQPALNIERTAAGALVPVTLTLDAPTLRQAAAIALQLVEGASGRKAIGVEVLPTDLHDRRVDEPSIPDLVGYAEVAELAGVSRQRARMFAEIEGFPPAVVTTQAGPLRLREHVEKWLERREPRVGRPKKAARTGA